MPGPGAQRGQEQSTRPRPQKPPPTAGSATLGPPRRCHGVGDGTLPHELLAAHEPVTAETTAHSPASLALGWGGDAHQPAPAPGTCSGPQGSASLHPPVLPHSLRGVPGA